MFEIFKLFKICFDMKVAGIPIYIIIFSFKGAIEFEGIFDLLEMWQKEKDPEEREETFECLIESLNDCYVVNRPITVEEIFEMGLIAEERICPCPFCRSEEVGINVMSESGK